MKLKLNDVFRRFSQGTANLVGHPLSFTITLILMIVWAAFGPYCDYSNGWQLVINSVSNIVALLMLFLIANTQNRDAKSLHLKVDELLNCDATARKAFISLENCDDDEIEKVALEFEKLHRKNRLSRRARKSLAPIN
jgi:low affinity Fe/Cu permease